MDYEEIKKICENVAIWDVEKIEWSDVRDLITIIEQVKDAILEVKANVRECDWHGCIKAQQILESLYE